MNCVKCHQEIPHERSDFLWEHQKPMTCISCSQEKAKITIMEYDHKTAPVMVTIDPDNTEDVRRARRAYRRSR
jgi:uncharacterized CHY-type Zn-finger protein